MPEGSRRRRNGAGSSHRGAVRTAANDVQGKGDSARPVSAVFSCYELFPDLTSQDESKSCTFAQICGRLEISLSRNPTEYIRLL